MPVVAGAPHLVHCHCAFTLTLYVVRAHSSSQHRLQLGAHVPEGFSMRKLLAAVAGAGTGGLAGAAVGSLIPGLGTAIGATIGGVSGAITAYLNTHDDGHD